MELSILILGILQNLKRMAEGQEIRQDILKKLMILEVFSANNLVHLILDQPYTKTDHQLKLLQDSTLQIFRFNHQPHRNSHMLVTILRVLVIHQSYRKDHVQC